jgi:hypothetical protein
MSGGVAILPVAISRKIDLPRNERAINQMTDILVAYGTSRDMNPSLPQEQINRAVETDPVRTGPAAP